MKRRLIQLLCVLVMAYTGWEIIQYFGAYSQVNEEIEQVQSLVQQQSLQTLQQQYSDVAGWITIEGMKVDYPILQTDNNEFYLRHNYRGAESRAGSIFLDYRNDGDFTDQHSIIYGHVLRNGSMFGQLSNYAEVEFAQQHQLIDIELADKKLKLQVFAAYETTTDFYYIETDFTDTSFANFIDIIQDKSQIDLQVKVTEHDQLFTLSTCTTSVNDEERFVVHAKVIEG